MTKVNTAIIIVTYNGANWLEKCIRPLYNKENIKVVVIDNNSTDDTVRIIKDKFSEVHLIESEVNLGFGQANNKGFEYAITNNFDYVFLLNQDASIDSGSLDHLIETYQKDQHTGVLSPVHYKDENDIENLFLSYLSDSKINVNEIGTKKVNNIKFVNAALWLISVENLIKLGGFNKLYFHYGEDVDFINRVEYFKLKTKADLSVKAYHYRNYSKENFKKNFDKSRYFGPWNIKYFTILSNINNSYIKVILISFKLFTISFLKYLLKGYFKAALMCVRVYMNIVKDLVKIKKNREFLKNSSTPFLDL